MQSELAVLVVSPLVLHTADVRTIVSPTKR